MTKTSGQVSANMQSNSERVHASVKLPHANTESIYVGYLPVPKGMNRFVTLITIVCVLWLCGMAGAIAVFMSDPGQAVWDTGAERQWVGKFHMTPYPMLITNNDDGSASDARKAFLVVGVGKFGVHERLQAFDGQVVQLTGWRLQREGRSMIELGMEPESISFVNTDDVLAIPQPIPLDTVVDLRPFESVGEIVDGKCYLGAMKPGNGFGHRACAVLCIQGGLPPMFVYEEGGQRTFAMLKVNGSTDLGPEVLGLVAQKVRVSGTTSSLAGLQIIEASSADIQLD